MANCYPLEVLTLLKLRPQEHPKAALLKELKQRVVPTRDNVQYASGVMRSNCNDWRKKKWYPSEWPGEKMKTPASDYIGTDVLFEYSVWPTSGYFCSPGNDHVHASWHGTCLYAYHPPPWKDTDVFCPRFRI